MLGQRLGPYEIVRELGAGGMGGVFAATAAEEAPGVARGDRVALKVVHPHPLGTEGFLPRFLREAELGARICHANVVRTLGRGPAAPDGATHVRLVLVYVEGQSLDGLRQELERVPEEHRRTMRENLRVYREILAAPRERRPGAARPDADGASSAAGDD